MVNPGMLENPSVKAWLGGIEPVWTLLTHEAFSALVADSEPPHGPVRLALDLTPDELALSPVVLNMRVLLQAAATGPGLKLTATGNLTRAVVAEMCDAVAWPGFDRTEAFRFTRVVNEPDFFPLYFLRHLAEASRLVRRRSGFLRIAPAGRRMLDASAQGSLQALLFHVAFWHMDLPLTGRGWLQGWPQREVGLVLWCLSLAARDWETRERLTRLCTVPINGVLGQDWDKGSSATEAQILLPLWWFGLLDHREEAIVGSRFEKKHFYRKSSLFDRFLTFEVRLEAMDSVRH